MREAEAASLRQEDVMFDKAVVEGQEREVMLLKIQKCKGNPHPYTVVLGDQPGGPVTLTKAWLAQAEPGGVLFRKCGSKDWGQPLAVKTPCHIMKKWVEELQANGPKDIVLAVVGNKIDRCD